MSVVCPCQPGAEWRRAGVGLPWLRAGVNPLNCLLGAPPLRGGGWHALSVAIRLKRVLIFLLISSLTSWLFGCVLSSFHVSEVLGILPVINIKFHPTWGRKDTGFHFHLKFVKSRSVANTRCALEQRLLLAAVGGPTSRSC